MSELLQVCGDGGVELRGLGCWSRRVAMSRRIFSSNGSPSSSSASAPTYRPGVST